ncbi:ExbD/TolR family protein [Ichthyobacterium seriolicida]|uniref:Biopolymer transport protein ExbD/TolR n=1 Tax=Ichthyobacterium seriolicida TaxID=242600 RepID=A0A1J1E4X9_9FLAO|nr:biopolymer transporter ExbD [Ichthyobacterium seriolicida]BAV94366.1 biopolymer transport protein ExbD/TolR [Ichthyobacterium seriolicida]
MNLKSRNKVSAEFAMSSMTDIVFLLLIFFMLTSTLVTTDAIDLILPKAVSGKNLENRMVSVSISNNLEYYIDKTLVRRENIESELKKIFLSEKEPNLAIRAEENVPVKNLVEIMDIANRNKYKVILAVRTK